VLSTFNQIGLVQSNYLIMKVHHLVRENTVIRDIIFSLRSSNTSSSLSSFESQHIIDQSSIFMKGKSKIRYGAWNVVIKG
jgi:hypothetical protein